MARYYSDLTTTDAVIRLLAKIDPSMNASPEQAEYDDFFDLLINDLIPQASRVIMLETNRAFVPYRDAKSYYFLDLLTERQNNRYKLDLGEDALLVSSVVYANNTLDVSQWRLHPSNVYPSAQLAISPQNALGFDSSDFNSAIVVTGVWGYHEQLAQAWTNVETIAGTINATVQTFEVADSSKYELLSYIRAESEYMQVIDRYVDHGHTPDTITVKRGVNGTTAAAHTAFAIDRWNVMPDIAYAAQRLAAWSYQNRSQLGTVQYIDGSSVVPQMPQDVRNILARYQRLSVQSA